MKRLAVAIALLALASCGSSPTSPTSTAQLLVLPAPSAEQIPSFAGRFSWITAQELPGVKYVPESSFGGTPFMGGFATKGEPIDLKPSVGHQWLVVAFPDTPSQPISPRATLTVTGSSNAIEHSAFCSRFRSNPTVKFEDDDRFAAIPNPRNTGAHFASPFAIAFEIKKGSGTGVLKIKDKEYQIAW